MPLIARGLSHGCQPPSSTLHAYVTPGSFALKANVAVVSGVEAAGPPVSETCGAVVSRGGMDGGGAGGVVFLLFFGLVRGGGSSLVVRAAAVCVGSVSGACAGV